MIFFQPAFCRAEDLTTSAAQRSPTSGHANVLAMFLALGLLCGATNATAARSSPFLQNPKSIGSNPPKADDAAAKAKAEQEERERLLQRDLEGWKKLDIKSMDQVMDVQKNTKPLEYPASVTDEIKAKMSELLQKAKDGGGGARTTRALKELEKMGLPALFFLGNQLREIDYKDAEQGMFGGEINGTMQRITMGINMGYVPVEVGQDVDPRKAQYNALTVQQWHNTIVTWWPNQEKFDEYIKNRKAKRQAELEGELEGEPKKDAAPTKKK